MAFGGGTWTVQNKILPGTYINTVSAAVYTQDANNRGTVAVPISLNWGPNGEVFTVTADEFTNNAKELFGYDAADASLVDLREIFKHASKAILCRVNGGAKAANTYAEAKYTGTAGNNISIKITESAETEDAFFVDTLYNGDVMDEQVVTSSDELTANKWVTWKDFEIAATAGAALTGGTNATTVPGSAYQDALNAFESQTFDVLACTADDAQTIALFTAYTKRLNDELGIKFQCVCRKLETGSDSEYIIEVQNTCNDDSRAHALVYWTAGACSACALNTDLTGAIYDGEHDINVDYTQAQLENFIKAGKFAFHRTGDVVRVLKDINTLVTYTDNRQAPYSRNKTVRVVNYIATQDAALFNEHYIGVYINNDVARSKLRNDLVDIRTALATIGAIVDYTGAEMTVSQGVDDVSVVMTDTITIAATMEKLYITETIG